MNNKQIEEMTGNKNWHQTGLKRKIIREYSRELRGSTNFDFYKNSKTGEYFIKGNKSNNFIKIDIGKYL